MGIEGRRALARQAKNEYDILRNKWVDLVSEGLEVCGGGVGKLAKL